MHLEKKTQAVCENTKIWGGEGGGGNMLAEQCFEER